MSRPVSEAAPSRRGDANGLEENVEGNDRIDPQHSCLLFFDTSNLFVNGPKLDPRDRPPGEASAIASWQRQLARARELRMMVAYALTGHRPDQAATFPRLTDMNTGGTRYPEGSKRQGPSRSIVGSPEMGVIDEIAPSDADYLIWKPRWDPFQYTALELSLRVRGIDTIILNGGSVEVGVAATAYAAQARDFDLVVVSDGCTSRDPDCYAALMGRIFPRIGRVRTTDQVLEMLG
jgi:nicotinamidase-related amidase